MEQKINLKDPETNEIIASVILLTIDWYDELIETWEYFLENIGGSTDDFVEYVNETTSIKIKNS